MKVTNMKTKNQLLSLLLVSVFLVFGTGCMIIHPQHRSNGQIISSKPFGKLPPGQRKKLSGDKSAKQYAPGQQKKHKKN